MTFQLLSAQKDESFYYEKEDETKNISHPKRKNIWIEILIKEKEKKEEIYLT